jgi:hypothetical protein
MKKCSNIEHKEINAISFCNECRIYMCNKCVNFHLQLFKNHHQVNIEKDKDEFIGICNIHQIELKYFCSNHNILCCSECIIKIQGKKNNQHENCKICYIEDIEKEKKNKLTSNIKDLEILSFNFQQTINEIKDIINKTGQKKEQIKYDIQKLFTNFRNYLNNKEDELLLNIDNKFDEFSFDLDIKKNTQLEKKIKVSLETGKKIEQNWEKYKLNSVINDCINIENNINYLNKLNQRVRELKSFDCNYNYEYEIIQFLENMKNLVNMPIKYKLFDTKIGFDEELVKSWLNNKNFKAELLFRKTRDGSTPKDFHNKCDNKGITLTIIETTKGYKFGGYAELPWNMLSGSPYDKSAFIFSFNNKKKYGQRYHSSPLIGKRT